MKKNGKKGVCINAGQLRRTQLITTYGPGAIADFPENCSVVMASIDKWREDKKAFINEPNLQRLLRVPNFMEPACTAGQDGPQGGLSDIPAWRFPYTGFCPACGRLGFFTKIGRLVGRKYYCRECQDKHGKKIVLLPSRFVSACINGHLADFPYAWWVHSFASEPCDVWERDLEIEFTGKTGGLDSIIIRCRACGAERSMAGCLGADSLKGFRCHGHRPCLNTKEQCAAQPRGMLRGASSIWFPLTASALTLPSARTRLHMAVSEKWHTLKKYLDKGKNGEWLKNILEIEFETEIEQNLFSIEDLTDFIIAKHKGIGAEKDENYDIRRLHEDEYAVLSTHQAGGDTCGDSLFHAVAAPVPASLAPYVQKVLLISRLREVMALYGFRRITPEKMDSNNLACQGYNLDKGYVPLSEIANGSPRTKWLPAVEMLGEGIFIQLKEDALQTWEAHAQERYAKLASNLAATNVDCPNFSARYVLLHTLSHLLIRQLALECGYSGASIRERIYSTFPDGQRSMAGLALYTSSTDADGSLGGLVRNGHPGNLERIFLNMLREASWCSTDPVCAESTGQGFGGLNYAACHACALLPETSCVMRNCLLDRIALIGTEDDPEIGFFQKLMRPAV